MVKERVDNGVLVGIYGEQFNGLYCSALYGPNADSSDDEYNYRISVVVDRLPGLGDPFHPQVVPAFVNVQGLTLLMTKAEATACANYIGC